MRDRLGQLLHQTGQAAGAEKMFRRAVALQSGLVRQHPEVAAYRFSLSLTQTALAHALADRGSRREAREPLEAASALFTEVLQSDPRFGFVRGFLAWSHRELAGVLTKLGEAELTAQALRKAHELDSGPRKRPAPGGPPGQRW